MLKNEKGITLTELLATIVISFFAMGIIYSVALLAINYFSVETTKTRLQQEANYIITELQRTHRQCEEYELIITSDKVEVQNCANPDLEIEVVSSFNKVISSGFTYGQEIQTLEYPKQSDLYLDLIVADPESDNLEVKISTAISRYKDL